MLSGYAQGVEWIYIDDSGNPQIMGEPCDYKTEANYYNTPGYVPMTYDTDTNTSLVHGDMIEHDMVYCLNYQVSFATEYGYYDDYDG